MAFKREEILKQVKEFHDLCVENKIWYSLDKDSLLSAFRHGGFIPWAEHLEVMMTPESYEKLKNIAPKHIIDFTIDPKYTSLKPSFINNINFWDKELPFITIRIIVPSTARKVQKFRKPVISRNSRYNIKLIIDELSDKKYEGFFTIDSRMSSWKFNWYQVFTFERQDVVFHNLKLKAVKSANVLLYKWYGENYLIPKFPRYYYLNKTPLKKVKIDMRYNEFEI